VVFKAKDGGLRGQGQRSSRPRPEVFEAKVKAKDLEAEVEASDLCDKGQSSMGCTKRCGIHRLTAATAIWLSLCHCMCKTRSSADADNRLDAFNSGQSSPRHK